MLQVTYYLTNSTNQAYDRVKKTDSSYLFEYPCLTNTLCEPYFVNLRRGIYQFELWGSSGGIARIHNSKSMKYGSSGNGSYVSGIISLNKSRMFYIYLGGQGNNQTSASNYKIPEPGGWNFGGQGGLDFSDASVSDPPENGAGGGGGVDIRLKYYDINSPDLSQSELLDSIKSRIIVAGSGGGACSGSYYQGQSGGRLEAITVNSYMFGGSQTNGYLGVGMNGLNSSDNKGATGGHGSGYRGGYYNPTLAQKASSFEHGSTGGSSYISGCPGCISVSPVPGSTDSDHGPIHFSGLYFTNTVMIPGNVEMEQPDGSFNIGHFGNGACRITIISKTIDDCKTHFACESSIFKYYLLLLPAISV